MALPNEHELKSIVTLRLGYPRKSELQPRVTMSRFCKLSQTLWCCQYHIVWAPKYRFRILEGQISKDVASLIRAISDQQGCEVVELNVLKDHVHLLVMVPPKLSISEYVGKVKGKTAIRILNKHRGLKKKTYWGNHFGQKAIVLIKSVLMSIRYANTSNIEKYKRKRLKNCHCSNRNR